MWCRCRDLASLDEHGYCKIIGRCKDMIIRGGENIYPAELEQFLHTHPKVEEVQVSGREVGVVSSSGSSGGKPVHKAAGTAAWDLVVFLCLQHLFLCNTGR